MAEKKVRMADIAQKLGVSIVSVSKAMAGKDGVSEETRKKIMETAREMGYVAPGSSRADGGSSGNIGILVADRFFSDNAFYSNLYRTVLMKSNSAGYSALLEIVSPEDERSCVMPAIIQAKKVDGLIFMGELGRNYMHAAVQSGLPYVLLDFYDEEFGGDSIISDSVNGSYRLTSHLLQTGRNRIAFVGSVFATSSIMDRYLGYVKALVRAGHSIRQDWRLEDRDETGRFVSIKLPSDMPQAFVCSCDEVAFNLTEQLKREGYVVPRDVAVTGYDDYRFSQISAPPLTTYRVNVEGMGTAVISLLLRKMRSKRTIRGNTVISGEFIRRKST